MAEARTVRLTQKIEGLRRQMLSLKAMGERVEASPDKQVSLTDPCDCAFNGSTSRQGHGRRRLQRPDTAVDAEHHLIVAHEVTNIGSDRSQPDVDGTQGEGSDGLR